MVRRVKEAYKKRNRKGRLENELERHREKVNNGKKASYKAERLQKQLQANQPGRKGVIYSK